MPDGESQLNKRQGEKLSYKTLLLTVLGGNTLKGHTGKSRQDAARETQFGAHAFLRVFPGGSDSKESACSAGHLGSVPGLGRSPEEGMATHSSILAWRIPVDGGAQRATVYVAAESDTTEKRSTAQHSTLLYLGLPWWLKLYRICLQCWRPSSIPGSGRSSGEGNGYPLQYSCLENSMDRGAWQATVHRVTELDTTKRPTLSYYYISHVLSFFGNFETIFL